jgi:ElaB/YqjD/DUF883 family membrane-anchored ribosome-binding protein
MERQTASVIPEPVRPAGVVESLSDAGARQLGHARDRMTVRLERARERLADAEREVAYLARRTARRADHYAHEHPWQTAGVGLALGVAATLAAWIVVQSRRR